MQGDRFQFARLFPAWRWLSKYNLTMLRTDLLAGLVITAILVPQAMAYATITGVPLTMGLYAGIVPMFIYALAGSSPTLSVGPTSVISMMVFSALSPLHEPGSASYIHAASLLALMSGVFLLLLGFLRFGFIIRLISQPVIKSFIIASALLVSAGQLKHLLDLPFKTSNLSKIAHGLIAYLGESSLTSLCFGLGAILFLVVIPRFLQHRQKNDAGRLLDILIKAQPLVLVFVSIGLVYFFKLPQYGIKIIGHIPAGFPPLSLPQWDISLLLQLLPAAILIAMISFVDSISIAQATALQQRSDLNSNQELTALGLANLGAGLSSAFPVAASFSRTVVSSDVGANSPMAGMLASVFILLVSLYLTGFLYYLPYTALAAIIMVSLWKLVEIKPFIDTWRYSRIDGIAMLVAFLSVMFIDVSIGLMLGIASTFALLLWRISQPHIAVIGWVKGTRGFRGVSHYQVITSPRVLSLRIDEDLNFLSADVLKECIIHKVSQNPQLQHVMINCPGVSLIDSSALDTLKDINTKLVELDINLHFTELRGSVMDQLKHSSLLDDLTGQVFFTHFQAMKTLAPELFQAGSKN